MLYRTFVPASPPSLLFCHWLYLRIICIIRKQPNAFLLECSRGGGFWQHRVLAFGNHQRLLLRNRKQGYQRVPDSHLLPSLQQKERHGQWGALWHFGRAFTLLPVLRELAGEGACRRALSPHCSVKTETRGDSRVEAWPVSVWPRGRAICK